MSMKNKTVIVTGSTSGIGLGIARGFAAEGANVVLNGFASPDEIKAAVDAVQGLGSGKVIYNGADMSKPDEIVAMVKSAEATFGAVDVLEIGRAHV